VSEITLHSDGAIYADWKDFTFIKTLNAICDYYIASLSIALDNDKTLPFKKGQPCYLKIDGKKKFTGYIETIEFDLDEEKADLKISGRSKTCDLVDCSIDLGVYEFTSIPFVKLVTLICAQYKITVVNKTNSDVLVAKWNIFPSETSWQCLERLSRKYGVIFYGDEDGNLVIGKQDPVDAEIDLNENQAPRSIKGKFSQADKFSKYVVLGQARNQIDAIAEVSDSSVQRPRTKTVLSETASTTDECKTRALWEKQISAQRSSDLSILLDDWTQGNTNKIWWTNLKIKVKLSYLSINQYYLITGIQLRQSEQKGQQTLLEFEEVNSFTI
jgi:prophage tail gpP-like protein